MAHHRYPQADLRGIIEALKARGLPVVGGFEDADHMGVGFQLDGGTGRYWARLKSSEASADEFERYYRIVA